jgi:hypothetical protein
MTDFALTYVYSDGTRSKSAAGLWSPEDLRRGWKQLRDCLREGFFLELRDVDTGQLFRLRAPRKPLSSPAASSTAHLPPAGEGMAASPDSSSGLAASGAR